MKTIPFKSLTGLFALVLVSLCTLSIAEPAITSDDFHGPGLNTALWTFSDPLGDSTLGMTGKALTISVPAGTSHTISGLQNNAPKVMQSATNSDFEIEVKFDSYVTQKYQIQGIIVQETPANLLRFDFYSDGLDTRIFAGTYSGGIITTLINSRIAAGSPLFMRIKRTGDSWTQSFSYNGQNWFTSGTFTHQMTVTETGVYAGSEASSASAPAHTGVIDYFFNTASPVSPEDGGELVAPVMDIWYGLDQAFGQLGAPQPFVNILGNVNDPDGISSLTYSLNSGLPLPLTTGPDAMRLQSQGDFNVEIAYTDLLCLPSLNTVTITAKDYFGNTTVRDVSVSNDCGNSWPLPYTIDWSTVENISDAAQVVDGHWTLDSGSLRPVVQGYDRVVAIGNIDWDDYEISVPITIHSLDTTRPSGGPFVGILMRWEGHHAWDSSQPRNGWWPLGALGGYDWVTALRDFRLRIIGNDMASIAEDTSGRHLTTGTTYVFKMRAKTIGGNSVYSMKVWEAGSTEPLLWDIMGPGLPAGTSRGSLLLLAHYIDASFGNVSVTPGPFSDEPTPPVISGLLAEPDKFSAKISWTTDKPATTIVYYGKTASYEKGSVNAGNLTTAHSITLTGLLPETLYHVQVSSIDNSGNRTDSGDLTFTTATDKSNIRSDDFNSYSLNTNIWTFINPPATGDSSMSMTGTNLLINVPAGNNHRIWTDGNNAPRIMQNANNTDFEIEVKFDSALSMEYQMQGIVIEQDPANFIRYDFYSDGNGTRIFAFAATLAEGTSSAKIDAAINNPGAPLYMRIKREADKWTQSYSFDGQNWAVSGIFNHSLTVTKVGVFVGNEAASGGTAPAYLGSIDYFFNTASPVVPEDGITYHPVTASAPGGNGTISCTSPVASGSSSLCTISPASGYILQSLTDNSANVTGSVANGAYTVVNVRATHTIVATFVLAQTAKMGDTNSDSTLNIVDALFVARYVSGLPTAPFDPLVADVNCDGRIDIVDALMIARKVSGLQVPSWCGN